MGFEQVAIGIKTFLRDEKLFRAIDGIRRNLPGAQIIVADDGEMTEEKDGVYADLLREGHRIGIYPFDSGFGFKSNRIVEMLDRPFLLIGSDDFDFTPMAALGVKKLIEVLYILSTLDIVSGRVNENPYEFFLTEKNGVVWETPIPDLSNQPKVIKDMFICRAADLTVNYSLIRRETFEKVRWDDGPSRIGGGEHGSFYVDVKRAGLKVGYVPGVNINEQPGRDSEVYRSFRNRARMKARPCFDARGIKRYVLGNGQVDYDCL